MKPGMHMSCLIYRFKMFLLTYFIEGQVKGNGKVFLEFRFYTAYIKLRRKLKENRGRLSKNKGITSKSHLSTF